MVVIDWTTGFLSTLILTLVLEPQEVKLEHLTRTNARPTFGQSNLSEKEIVQSKTCNNSHDS